MKYIAGFIGAGNMGGALLSAAAKQIGEKQIAVCGSSAEKTAALAKKFGCAAKSACEIAKECKFVFLGVKPNILPFVLEEIRDCVSKDCVLVSMAAGVTLNTVRKLSGCTKIIRIMPNTPCSVGRGTVLYSFTKEVSPADEREFLDILSHCGQCDRIPENQIDAASAVSGCGPAFVYMFIEALADGAVKCGLPRSKALLYAEQTVMGSAALAIEAQKHPEQLKDEVCSPGGSTIEGVLSLEKDGFRGAVSDAVSAAFEKTKKLGADN
ncbi:MAG: pyrroline-5-carboxylate reductase [Acutalibacteraceae bacterium]